MLAIELVEDRATKQPAAALAGRVVELARERGLLLMGAGIYSNCVRVLVPLVATDADIDQGFEILEGTLRDAKQ
jgi:4-aminobutyrate aminotransferase/(S)-3-amino-2-methylpropionate transaminase